MVQQIQFISIAKGIAILLVLLGHVAGTPNILNKYIHSFHMPVFFFLSGYFFNEKYLKINFFHFLKIRWKRLIAPYFFMSLICYILFILYPGIIKILFNTEIEYWYFMKPIIRIIYSIGTIEWLPNCSPLWFLTCLFITQIIFFQVLKNTTNYKHLSLITLAIGF